MLKISAVFFSFFLLLMPAMLQAAGDEWFPVGHPDQGLPRPDFLPAPYDENPDHLLNRVFRSAFLAELVPAEVGLALPREHADPEAFFRKSWYFAVRAGLPSDRRLFGGDGRLFSREGFEPGEAADFGRALAEAEGEALQALRKRPEMAVLFQNDLLRVAQRLMETGRNRELLRPIASAVRRLSLPSAEIDRLPFTSAMLPKSEIPETHLPRDLLRTGRRAKVEEPYVELLRNSTLVFNASRTLAWSRVFISWPEAGGDLSSFLSAGEGGKKQTVPVGVGSVLVQGIVAVNDQGRPQAAPLAFDVRVKWLANRDPLSPRNPTTSRDGVQIRAYELRRASLRQGAFERLFRSLHDEDQFLFRDYGTLKHTTLSAQCTLCHRLTGAGDAHLGGFIVLGPSAKPRPAASGTERLRLAETEVAKFLSALWKTTGN